MTLIIRARFGHAAGTSRLFWCLTFFFEALILAGGVWSLAEAQPKPAEKADEAEVRIGALLHLTGEFAPYGQAFLEGALVAADEINSGGGLQGKRLKLIVEDTQYRSATTNAAARKLLEIDRVLGALITTAHEAKTAGPLFESSHAALMSLWDSSPELDAMGSYIFGIGTWSPASGEVAAREARNRFGASRAGVLYSSTGWSLGVAQPFIDSFPKLGGVVLLQEAFDPGTTDFRSVLLRLKQLHPEVIYAPVDDNLPSFFRQLREQHFEVPIITSDLLTEDMFTQEPELYEGIYQTQSVEPNTPQTERMKAGYRRRYGREPGFVIYSAWGYDGVMLMALAAQKGQWTREGLARALYDVRGYPGATGSISIDSAGSSRAMVSLFQVKRQKLGLLEGR